MKQELETGKWFVMAEHTHAMQDWTQLIWLCQNVHAPIGHWKSSVVVVDCKWEPFGVKDDKFVSKMKTLHPGNFFKNVTPSLDKFHMLSKGAEIFFPMHNEWFFFMVHVSRAEL